MRYVLYSTGTQPINKHFLQIRRHLLDADVIGCVQKDIIFWDDHGYGQWFWSEDDIKRINEDGKKLLNPKIARKSISDQKKAVEEYWLTAKRLLKAVEEGVGDEELAAEYELYSEALRRVYAHFQTSVAHTTHALECMLYETIERMFQEDARKKFSIITTPEKPDLIFEELQEWAKVLNNPTRQRILDHSRKYSFLLPNFFSEREVLVWAHKRMRIEPLGEISDRLKEYQKKKRDLKRQQRLITAEASSRKVSYVSSVLRELSLTRLLIKNCWNGEAFHMLPFFKHVAKKAGSSIEEVYFFYTSEEIHNLLANGRNISRKELRQRKKFCLLHLSNGKIGIYSGQDALRRKRRLLDPSIPGRDIRRFEGTVASRGRIVGKVFVLKEENPARFNDISKALTKDHILVTGMTNPSMAIFINRIGGIITDEGGVACHAAIISREFNLPCLVGCKVATLVLEDGDYVLLDAEKGFVRRITDSEYQRRKKTCATDYGETVFEKAG